MPLVVPVQDAQAVSVDTDATVGPPAPLVLAVQVMIVVISPVQCPVLAHNHPLGPSPSLEDAQAIQVTSNTTVPAPEPASSSVVVISTVQMPVGAHVLPAIVPEAAQDSQAVQMHTNATVPTPEPTEPTM